MTEQLDIVERLRKHVNDRGGASLQNGAWQMMIDAADEIEDLRSAVGSINSDWDKLYEENRALKARL